MQTPGPTQSPSDAARRPSATGVVTSPMQRLRTRRSTTRAKSYASPFEFPASDFYFLNLVGLGGFEPPTSSLGNCCSIHLSYSPTSPLYCCPIVILPGHFRFACVFQSDGPAGDVALRFVYGDEATCLMRRSREIAGQYSRSALAAVFNPIRIP